MCPHNNLRMSSTFSVFQDTGEIVVQTVCFCADCKTRLQFCGPRTNEVVNQVGEPINHGRPTISDCGYILTTPVAFPEEKRQPTAREQDEGRGKVLEFRPRDR